MDLSPFNPTLEALSYVITLLGLPAAIYVYLREHSKERREREYGTYNALDDKYLDFLKLCLENADLNIYPQNLEINVRLTPQQESKKLVLFEILISILERSYLMYRDQSSKIKQNQWIGWNEYMEDWMARGLEGWRTGGLESWRAGGLEKWRDEAIE